MPGNQALPEGMALLYHLLPAAGEENQNIHIFSLSLDRITEFYYYISDKLNKKREVHIMDRTSKENYYLGIADAVQERSTCMRRKYGAIIVRNDEIISTGYNGAPRGRKNCNDLGYCAREAMQIPSGERYELCRSVHAEANAIISASRRDMIGSTLYLVGRDAKTGELLHDTTSCSMCRRQIINAGIVKVVARIGEDDFTITNVDEWILKDDSVPQMK